MKMLKIIASYLCLVFATHMLALSPISKLSYWLDGGLPCSQTTNYPQIIALVILVAGVFLYRQMAVVCGIVFTILLVLSMFHTGIGSYFFFVAIAVAAPFMLCFKAVKTFVLKAEFAKLLLLLAPLIAMASVLVYFTTCWSLHSDSMKVVF